MPYTINLHLLDNKQIKVDMGGIPLGNENSYRIYEHEENVTQFEIISKPAEYENADYYVIFINSQNKRAFLNDIIPDPVTDDGQLIVDDTFMLPVGMTVKGYGYIRIYAIQDNERIEFQPIKIKVWNTVETWKDYVTDLNTPATEGWVEQYVDNALAEIDLSGYVQKTTTIAGIDLQDNITAGELRTALNVADGAQVNILEGVKDFSGNDLAITSKKVQLNKAAVGLGNVVDTADSDTPVSGGTTKFTTGGAFTEFAKRADKVSGATNGNFAGLDSNGNLTDSGKKASDFSKVSVSNTGTATDEVQYITIDGVEKKIAGGTSDYTLLKKYVLGYSILTEQPENWSTNYTDYYVNAGTTDIPNYVANIYSTWQANTYYEKTTEAINMSNISITGGHYKAVKIYAIINEIVVGGYLKFNAHYGNFQIAAERFDPSANTYPYNIFEYELYLKDGLWFDGMINRGGSGGWATNKQVMTVAGLVDQLYNRVQYYPYTKENAPYIDNFVFVSNARVKADTRIYIYVKE